MRIDCTQEEFVKLCERVADLVQSKTGERIEVRRESWDSAFKKIIRALEKC